LTSSSPNDERLWSIGELSDPDGGTTLVRYRASPEPKVRARLPMQFVVTWRFREPQEGGLPDSAEHEEASSMEDALVPVVEGRGQALLVVVSTGSGVREWYFYCRDPLELERAFNDTFAASDALPVELHSGEDPAWEVYEEYVAPFETRH
jgi:hypothetical protein